MELFQKLYRTTTLLFSCGKILDFTDFQHSHVVSKYWVTDSFSFSILSYSRFRVLKARGTQVTFFFFKVYLFTLLFTYVFYFIAVHELSRLWATLWLQCVSFSFQWLLLLQSMGFKCSGFSSCSVWAQQLRLIGLVAPWHVESSQTRHWTSVPCSCKVDS